MLKDIALIVFSVMFFHLPADAAPQAAAPQAPAPQAAPFQYVGSISINPSQDAKVLADWYSKFGFETHAAPDGGYYAMWTTAEGSFFFGIHRKKDGAPLKSSASVSVVFHVKDYDGYVNMLEGRGLAAESKEADAALGRFAHYKDPDGNEMTIWGD
jgi:predicted enzyme related to lactoylglutathione lyase